VKIQKKEVRFVFGPDLELAYHASTRRMHFKQGSRDRNLLLDGLSDADIEEFIHLLRKMPNVSYTAKR